MKKRHKYTISILISLGLAFAFLQILFYLFPYCGLKVIVSFPVHLILAIITGIILSNLIWSKKISTLTKTFFSTGIFLLLFGLQAQTYTQDSGAPTTTKILNSFKATLSYSDLKESDYSIYNDEEKIVYNAKFNKSYNKEYYSIHSHKTKFDYYIVKEGDNLIYDKSLLQLDIKANPNRIIEIDSKGNKTISEIDDIGRIFENKANGVKGWLIVKIEQKLVGYEKILDKLNRKRTIDNM